MATNLFRRSDCLKWVLIFDNLKGKLPRGRLLTAAYNFTEFMKNNVDVELLVHSQSKFHKIEFKEKSPEKELTATIRPLSTTPLDGVVSTLTNQTAIGIFENSIERTEFLSILVRLKKNAPLVLSTGKIAFNTIISKGYLKEFNVIFLRKNRLNWFTSHLKELFLKQIQLQV